MPTRASAPPRLGNRQRLPSYGVRGASSAPRGSSASRRKAAREAVKDVKEAYDRIRNGDNAYDAVADKITDKIADRANIPVGPTGRAINAFNDGMRKIGMPKSVTDTTQMVADAVPANFIQTAFGSAVRMLKGPKAVVAERDKMARGELGAPLQGYGQASRLLQCAVSDLHQAVFIFDQTVQARGCSAYQALSFATKGAENTMPYKIGSAIGGGIFSLTADGRRERRDREESARNNRDIGDNQAASTFAKEAGLKKLTARQMREVQEKCDGSQNCIQREVIARQGLVDAVRTFA
jgi:hypothetical protein